MSTSSYRNSKVSGGVERSFESIDVRHDKYPVAVYLVRERFYNSHRHGATKVILILNRLPNKNFKFTVRDNGNGDADVNRLLEPAEESGMTSSQYGFGERIWRLKASGREMPSLYAWKKAGDTFYHVLRQTKGAFKQETVNITPTGIWTKPEEHGFYSEMEFLLDRLEERSPEEFITLLRSVLCMSLSKDVLANLHIQIEVRDENGELLREVVPPGKLKKNGEPRKTREPRVVGRADSKEDAWVSLEQVVRDNPHETFAPVVIEGELSTGAHIEVVYTKLKPCAGKTHYDGLKEYTDKKGNGILVKMHGFIAPITLPDGLGKAPHPASQNGRFALITIRPPTLTPEQCEGKTALEIEQLQQRSMPTLASSKVSFLSSCPVYQEMIHFLRGNKPAQWDAFVKKSGSDTESPSTSPSTAPPSPRTLLIAKLHAVLALLMQVPTSAEKEDLVKAIRAYLRD